MGTKPKATFVFPVFNEELNIDQVLLDLDKLEEIARPYADRVETLFIDDGSTDRTAEMLRGAKRANLTVLRHPENRGPGAAFQTAFSHILGAGADPEDLIVTLEGDATSDPSMLVRMLKRTEEGDGIILASPYLYGGGFSGVLGHRVLLSHVANILYKLLLNIRGLATFSCFYRVHRARALRTIQEVYGQIVEAPGFECAAEVVVKAVRCQIPISEVPFRVDWSRRKGRSKMRIVRTSVGYLKMFVKYFEWSPHAKSKLEEIPSR